MKKEGVLKEDELRELTKGMISSERMEKESAISWDGRNFIIRIPREMASYFDINENNRFEKNFKFTIEEKNGTIEKTFDVIQRTKPIKQTKNEKSENKKEKNNKS